MPFLNPISRFGVSVEDIKRLDEEAGRCPPGRWRRPRSWVSRGSHGGDAWFRTVAAPLAPPAWC